MRSAIPALLIAAVVATGCASPLVHRGTLDARTYRALWERTAAGWGAAPQEPAPARVVHRDEVGPLLRELVADDWQPGDLAVYQDGLTALGLWPADRDLLDEHVAVSREEIAGLYAPSRGTLFVVGDRSAPFSMRLMSLLSGRDLYWETTLTHEIVHALQHQRYPELMDAVRWRGQDDAANAAIAAIEGDAMRYGFSSLGVGVLPGPEAVRAQTEAAASPTADGALARAPALLRLTLLYPYIEGYRMAYTEGVALLEHPPASTEQALHGDQRHAPFLAIDLTPLRARVPAGCDGLSENGMGELGISVLLRDLDGDQTSPGAWWGWHGDRYLAVRCDGRRAFVWLSVWDSESDAAEFAAAYLGIVEAVRERAELADTPRVRRRGREVHVWTAELAALAEELGTQPRRAEVSTLRELHAFFPEEVP